MNQETLSEGKKRSTNFTYSEKSFVFKLIAQQYGSILEDKKTDRASLQKREAAWKLIEKDFNAVSPSNNFRDASALKKLYSNKKKELRKKVAEEEKEVLVTGGGPPPKVLVKTDDIDNILLSIVNEKSVQGLNNPVDSDIVDIIPADVGATSMEFLVNDSSENVHMKQCMDENVDPIEQEEQVSEAKLSWAKYTPSDLTRPKNPLLESKGRKSTNTLSTPISRRRPTTGVKILTSSGVAQKYDLLLDKRLVLVDKQIKQVEDEHALNVKRKNLEIESLQLEIALKKKQLNLI